MKLDENMKKIEEIVSSMENPELSIGDGLKLYEQGVELAKECLSELNTIKGKVTAIKKDLDAYIEENLD
jgi:exodeoxyribonuclease VII small subunit